MFVLCAALCLVWQGLAQHFGYKRYFISAEFAAALALGAMGWRWMATGLFVVAASLEPALGAASLLKLFNIDQLETMLGFSLEANAQYQVWAIAGAVLLLLLWWGLLKAMPKARGRWLGGALAVLAAVQAGMSFADGNFSRPVTAAQNRLLMGSATWFLHEQFELNGQVFELGRHDNVAYVAIKHPSAVQLAWGGGLPKAQKVLVVVAESWGLPRDTAMLEAQMAPVRAVAGLEVLNVGTVHAVGATAIAEFRELCGRLPTKLNLNEISRERVGDCLPATLKDRGYKTVGMHGAAGSMYKRERWYPALGLDELLFSEQLQDRLSGRCYSFPGLCDRDMAGVVKTLLSGTAPTFIYWLSLNSHMPYDKRDLAVDRPDVCKTALPPEHAEQLCVYHQLHLQFFEELAHILAAPGLHDVEVLVVGDHTPPFNSSEARDFFEKDEVPWLHLRVR